MRIIWVTADFPALYTLEEPKCIVICWPVGPIVWGGRTVQAHSVGPASRIGCQQQSLFWPDFKVAWEVILCCQDGAIVDLEAESVSSGSWIGSQIPFGLEQSEFHSDAWPGELVGEVQCWEGGGGEGGSPSRS